MRSIFDENLIYHVRISFIENHQRILYIFHIYTHSYIPWHNMVLTINIKSIKKRVKYFNSCFKIVIKYLKANKNNPRFQIPVISSCRFLEKCNQHALCVYVWWNWKANCACIAPEYLSAVGSKFQSPGFRSHIELVVRLKRINIIINNTFIYTHVFIYKLKIWQTI